MDHVAPVQPSDILIRVVVQNGTGYVWTSDGAHVSPHPALFMMMCLVWHGHDALVVQRSLNKPSVCRCHHAAFPAQNNGGHGEQCRRHGSSRSTVSNTGAGLFASKTSGCVVQVSSSRTTSEDHLCN